MKKRILGTFVWFYASWTAVNMVTYMFDWAYALGPIVAAATGLVVGLDPWHWVWARTATSSTPTAATQEPASA